MMLWDTVGFVGSPTRRALLVPLCLIFLQCVPEVLDLNMQSKLVLGISEEDVEYVGFASSDAPFAAATHVMIVSPPKRRMTVISAPSPASMIAMPTREL